MLERLGNIPKIKNNWLSKAMVLREWEELKGRYRKI